MSPGTERTSAAPRPAPSIRIRPARPSDRGALIALGHEPALVASLCPSLGTRLSLTLAGLRTRMVLAEKDEGGILGSVQFVRARRQTGTWMFGHWRVAPPHRRQGIGRRLIEAGIGLVPGIHRLYSFVDWGNEISILAHRRLGFEAGRPLQGSAPLGTLSTLGPTTPAVRLRPLRRRFWPQLVELYRRAIGSLWLELFPGDERSFSPTLGTGLLGPLPPLLSALRDGPARLLQVEMEGEAVGFLVWRGRAGSATLFVDPERCDAGLLAKAAVQVAALGAPRGLVVELRGLPEKIVSASGPITARVLMGMPKTGRP